MQELIDRLLFVQALETQRCFDDGVLAHARDADVGSILGIGFPAWTGGAMQFLRQYGMARAVERVQALAAKHGERFAPPASLLER